MATGDLARLSVIYLLGTDLMVNTFGFSALDGSTTRSDLATAFQTALIKNSSGGLFFNRSANLSSTTLRVQDVKPGTGATVELNYAAVVGSGSVGDDLPPQCCQLYSWRTSLAGRSNRGRTYMPGLGEGQQAGGVIGAGAVTAFATVVTQLLAVFGPGGSNTHWQFGIISHRHNNAPVVPPAFNAVTLGITETTVQTQRRRNN